MPNPPVPAHVPVKYKRVRNVDTDRLQRRLAWLRENAPRLVRNLDGPDNPGGRPAMRHLAREVLTVEHELARRAS
ncbi:MAG TPA: hypothetical protein VMX12_02010 [Acidimicrobiia bacterium]|nr:hypothetical protein [Acidimicrobiia bacterium]